MSKLRQSPKIATFVHDYPSGAVVPEHAHDRDQLVYGSNGTMTIHIASGVWVTPPDRAVWIPAGVRHSIEMSGPVAMRSLYFLPERVPGLPRTCCVVGISGLLKELILHVCAMGAVAGFSADGTRLMAFLTGQMRALSALPLDLPAPTDQRARRLAERLSGCDGSSPPLSLLCRESGGSRRTLERLFREETGLSLGKWHQRLRLIRSLQRLGEGVSVTQVAFEAGYASTSAFCVAFRTALGTTPTAYFRAARTAAASRNIP